MSSQVISGSDPNAAPADAGDLTASPRLGPSRFWDLGERYGLVVLFVLVFLFFSFWSETSALFPTHANIVATVGSQMIVLLIAAAAMLPLTARQFDLSPGAIAGASSIVCAATMANFHHGPVLGVVLGVLTGVVLGTVNGVLVAHFKLSAVITTLAMSTSLTGVMEWYTHGGTITNNISSRLTDFGSLNWLGLPRLLYLVLPIIVALWFLLEWTPFGRYVQAISSNERAARLVGLHVDRAVASTFILGGFLAGIAGVLITARVGAADSTTGPSYLFPALAAVFLGATTIRPGRPNTLGTVIGVFFVAESVSGLSLAGASSWISDLFNGVVLFVAAGLSTYFARQRGGARIF